MWLIFKAIGIIVLVVQEWRMLKIVSKFSLEMYLQKRFAGRFATIKVNYQKCVSSRKNFHRTFRLCYDNEYEIWGHLTLARISARLRSTTRLLGFRTSEFFEIGPLVGRLSVKIIRFVIQEPYSQNV